MTEFTFTKKDIAGEGGRKIYLHAHYLLMKVYYTPHPEFPLYNSCIAHFKNDEVSWFFLSKDKEYWKEVLQETIRDKTRLPRLEKHTTVTAGQSIERLKNRSDLGQALKQYYEDFHTLSRTAASLRNIDRGIVYTIRENSKYTNPDEVLRTISALTKPSFFVQEELAMLKAALVNEKNAAQRLHRIYSTITAGYYNEQPRELSFYQNKLGEMKSNDPAAKIRLIEEKLQKEKEERAEFVSHFDNPDLAEIASESTYLKDYYKFMMNQLISASNPLFEEVASRLGLSAHEVKDTLPEELIESIHSGKVTRTNSIDAQKNNIIVVDEAKYVMFVGNEALQFETEYLKTEANATNEFKGRVASPGNVTGQAIVIKGPKEFHKMKKDQILVVVNTSPDYVPIMHLAKGIVADEGGLTAHVSVVSREFKIPAIVGIRGITSIIKDGDTIELDSQKGVVKILK